MRDFGFRHRTGNLSVSTCQYGLESKLLIFWSAIIGARKIIGKNKNDDTKNVDFIVDDILNSKINDNEFDYVFDRGCFHVLPINKRLTYILK